MDRDNPKAPALDWVPYSARLGAAGISWKVYQEFDNYGDNSLALFARYRGLGKDSPDYAAARAWVAGSNRENAAATRGEHLIRAFAADVAAACRRSRGSSPRFTCANIPTRRPLTGRC